jgi:hypothetical protein
MVQDFKLSRIFSPQGVFSGYALLFFGIITSIFTWTGIVVFIIGAGLAFSYYGVNFEQANNSIFIYIKWFGIIKRGKWVKIEGSSRLRLESYKGKFTLAGTYKKGSDTKKTTYQIVIENELSSEKFILARFKDLSIAKNEAEKLKKVFFPGLGNE